MSEEENARLARIEALLEQLLATRSEPVQVSFTAKEFAQQVGRSARWVQEKVSIGAIPRVKVAGTRNVLIPASALDAFRTGRARL